MGFHGDCNFRKKRNVYMSKHKINTLKKKNRRRNRRPKEGHTDFLDVQLMCNQHLRQKRRTNPMSNIGLSNKKRNKLLKALRFACKNEEADEESSDEFEDETTTTEEHPSSSVESSSVPIMMEVESPTIKDKDETMDKVKEAAKDEMTAE